MAQNITLLGASYSDVPSVELPKTGGGTAQFDDTTIASNAASASDITSGKLAFVNGELVTGTASGGGATLITKSITANGTYNASSDNADGYSSVTVNVSGGGGGGSMSDPIRFFDYDGTLVASYSSVPASLPSVPSHTGLTNGTWNYTLQEVTTQYNAMGTCDVGANYDTVSGATEIDIVLQEGRLHPYLSLAVDGEVSIDWGDNSTSTSTGTSLTSRKSDIHHEYAAAGSYTIKITKTSGTGYSLYCSSVYYLLNKNAATNTYNKAYANCVIAVRVGAYCEVRQYAFYFCTSLERVSIPAGASVSSVSTFGYTYSLEHVTIPSGTTTFSGFTRSGIETISIPPSVTQINGSGFSYCLQLRRVSIPGGAAVGNASQTHVFQSAESLASFVFPSNTAMIPASCFSGCSCITTLEIPSSVTAIDNSAFSNCVGMDEYHFKRTESVPTLGTNVFSNIIPTCKIYVPASKLNDYQTAENWSVYADYMVGE